MGAATDKDSLLRFKGFKVELVGVENNSASVDGSWNAFSGGVPTLDSNESTDSATGLRTYTPGLATVSDITLKGFITPTRKSLTTWLNKVFAGEEMRSDITITSIKVDGTDGPQNHYFSCLITNYKFPTLDVTSAEPAEEVITCKAMRHETA